MKHPHAELMAQYAQDAMETDKPWERWECSWKNGTSVSLGSLADHPSWRADINYCRKQKPYEPTLLDQALELEIEAAALKCSYYAGELGAQNVNTLLYGHTWRFLMKQRSPAMIEHLKQQGKP